MTRLAAGIFWLCVWQAASMAVHQKLLLASPFDVCKALAALLPTADFRSRILRSAAHIIGGFLTAAALGALLAALAGACGWLRVLLSPLMRTVQAVPVASFIILALVWLGGSARLSIVISFLMVLPVVYANTLAGVQAADEKLLEMAALFRVPYARRVRRIWLPAALPFFRSACAVGLGVCWKSGVAAEVIGVAGKSIGEALYNAKISFDTAELFAWTVVIVLLSAAFERLFLWALGKAEQALCGGESV